MRSGRFSLFWPSSLEGRHSHHHDSLLPGSFLHLSTISTQHKLSSQRRYRGHSHSQHQSRNMSSLKAQASPEDPIERTSSPYPDPRQLGPKSKILATRTSNFHSTSLRMVTASNPSVNRTCELPSLYLADATTSTSTSQLVAFVHSG